jgi:hypothetical protein
MALYPGDKLGPYENVAGIRKGGVGGALRPPRARKIEDFGFADPNNSNITKWTAFVRS